MSYVGARKRAKYNHLVVAAGYRVKLITLEVGSRGMLGEENIHDLREAVEAGALFPMPPSYKSCHPCRSGAPGTRPTDTNSSLM